MHSFHRTLILAALASQLPMLAAAQTIEARPGLWAEAHVSTLNGKRMPSILDIQGALKPQERAAIVNAMNQLGLPAGWAPALSCASTSSYDVQALAKSAGDGACTVSIIEQRRDGARFAVSCTGQLNGKGQGEVKVLNQVQAESRYSMDGTYQGQPVKFEQKSQSKWIGADCSHPPQGIDPSWLKQGNAGS